MCEALDDDRYHRGDNDRDEDCAPHLPDPQSDHQQETEAEHERGPAVQRAARPEFDRHGCVGRVGDATHPARVDEADEGDEQTDAHRDGDLQLRWHRVEDGLAKTGQNEHEDDDSLDDDQPHGICPCGFGRDAERHESVQAEPGGQSQRVVGDETHQDRHHASYQCGASCDGGRVRGVTPAEVVAVAVLHETEDDRVERHDVGHGEERHQATT